MNTHALLNDLIQKQYDAHKTYAYTAGYMQTTVDWMLMDMPKKAREKWINQFKTDLARLQGV